MTGPDTVKRRLDVNVALSHVDGDRQLLAELAAIFIQDYPRLCEELRESIVKADASSLERAAHTLKGRLAFFGAQKLREQALGLEMIGRAQNIALAAPALAEIEAEMENILPEFQILAHEQTQ